MLMEKTATLDFIEIKTFSIYKYYEQNLIQFL